MIRVALLGEESVVDQASGEVRARSCRSLTVAGLLIANAGHHLSRSRVAGTIWPDSSEPQALTNLRRELHQLRRILLDDTCLEVTQTDLCWRASATCTVDSLAFVRHATAAREAAERDAAAALAESTSALDSYHGDFLTGIDEPWAEQHRSELRRLCIDTCDLVARVASRAGDGELALEAARRRVLLAPAEEVGYRTVMRLYAERGDRAGVLTTFHTCAEVLQQELGVVPDPSTEALRDRLLREDPGEPVFSTGHTPRPTPGSRPLVGRPAEVDALVRLWRRLPETGPVAVAVSGEPGVGKSRLVDELAEVAESTGGAVARSQCYDSFARLSLAPVADWLRAPALRGAVDRLPAVWRAEVGRLAPAQRPDDSSAVPGPLLTDAWQRHRFFEGLTRAFHEVGRPTLLVLDDLQWCDQETLAFLTFLLHRSGDTPLMLAGTVHPEHDNRAVTDWLRLERRSASWHDIDLEPLDPVATSELAATVRGGPVDPALVGLLHDLTGGYPLYVVEAAAAGIDPSAGRAGGRRTDEVLRHRLEQPTREAQEVAGLAAAVGRDFTLPLLVEAGGLAPDAVARGIDELWRRRILREREQGYDFSHDLLRETAYRLVPPARRTFLHRQLAAALERTHEGRLEEVAAQLAHQYRRAGDAERALGYHRVAGDAAARMQAHADAVHQYRTALDLTERVPPGRARDALVLDLLQALAPVLTEWQGYAAPELQGVVERAVEVAERIGDRDALLRAMVGLWASRYVQGRTLEAHRIAERMTELVGPGDPMWGQTQLSLAASLLHLGRPESALGHFEEALGRLGSEKLVFGTRASVHARAWSAHAVWLLGDLEEAAGRATAAVTEARRSAHPYSLAVALAYAAITEQLCGDTPSLRSTVDELIALCDRYRFAYYGEWGRALDGWLVGGSEGTARIRTAIDRLRAQHAGARMPYWLSLLADTADEPGQARAALDAALVAAQVYDDRWLVPALLRRRACYDHDERHRR